MRYRSNDIQHRRVEFVRENIPVGSTVFSMLESLEDLDYAQEYTLYSAEILYQDQVSARTERVLGNRPDPMQHRRVQLIREKIADVTPEEFRHHILALIDTPLREGRDVYLIGTEKTRNAFHEEYASRYALVEVALLSGPLRNKLFTPSARPSPALTRNFYIMRVESL